MRHLPPLSFPHPPPPSPVALLLCVVVFFSPVLLTSFFVQPSLSIREKAQILRRTGMKRVLLLGSGYVSGPVVEYLTRDDKTQVTVGEFS